MTCLSPGPRRRPWQAQNHKLPLVPHRHTGDRSPVLHGEKGSTAARLGGHGCGQGSWAPRRPTSQIAFRWQREQRCRQKLPPTGQLRQQTFLISLTWGPESKIPERVGWLLSEAPRGSLAPSSSSYWWRPAVLGAPWGVEASSIAISISTRPSSLSESVSSRPHFCKGPSHWISGLT